MDNRTRKELSSILERGIDTVCEPSTRRAWKDGIPELVAAIGRHFTPEEIEMIMGGTLPPDTDPEGRPYCTTESVDPPLICHLTVGHPGDHEALFLWGTP